MTRALTTLALAASILTLAGCATTAAQCDPSNRDASLIEKLSCDSSGAYRANIDEREQKVRDSEAENQMFRRIFADIEDQRLAIRGDLRDQYERQRELDASLNAMTAELEKRSQQELGLRHKLNDFEDKRQQGQQSPGDNKEEQLQRLAELEQEVRRLQQSLGY